jgi:hypothetical protein
MLVALALFAPAHALAATYYVKAGGDDNAAGTSVDAAWGSTQAVLAHTFQPGDQILFEGGKTFEAGLWVPSSGSPLAPIVIGSFGTGQATLADDDASVIWLHNISYLTIQNLRLTAFGLKQQLILSSDGTSTGITVKNCALVDTGSFAINSANLGDSGWQIVGNTFQDIAETAITFRGSGFLVQGNRIVHSGFNPALEHAHAIYAKGPRPRIIGNTIDGFQNNGISIRYEGSYVVGNKISNGPAGIAFFQESSHGATTTIAYNQISRVSDAGIYLDKAPLESFVVANNTITTDGKAPALNFARVKSLVVANNSFVGGKFSLLAVRPSGRYSEHHNVWWPAAGTAFVWNGLGRNLSGYAKASGQGKGDVVVAPSAGVLANAGSTLVSGVKYTKGCDGAPFHYCGTAPDIGAVESRR